MNQILDTGRQNGNKRNKKIDIQGIIIFFVIFIILFAICIIFIGANLLSKVHKPAENPTYNQTGTPNPPVPEEPKIEIEFQGEPGQVKIVVTSTNNIRNIDYWWDDEEPTSLQPYATSYETVVASRQGTHTLNVEVTDVDMNIENESQTVIGDSAPELILGTDGVSNYIIKASDDEGIEKVVIVLNGETEEIQVNDKQFERSVPIPEGNSLIDVTVYNLHGLTANKKGKLSNFHK